MVNNPLKILWLCPYPVSLLRDIVTFKRIKPYHPAPWLVNQISYLSKRNDIELNIISLNAHISNNQIVKKDNVTFYLIKKGIRCLSIGYPVWLRLDLFTLFYKDISRIKKIVNIIKPDIIHAFGTEVPYAFSVLKINYPKVISLQGLMIEMSTSFPLNLNYRIMSLMEKKTINNSHYFISQSSYVTKYLQRINKDLIIEETKYIVNECFYAIERSDIRKRDILFVGSIRDKNKGFHILLDAFIKLRSLGYDYSLRIIGNNNGFKQKDRVLQNKIDGIKDYIQFLGRKTQVEIAQIFKESGILVIPSLMESYSMTVAEGLVSGVPIIASNTGSIPFLIEDGFNGILFETNNSNDLFLKILYLGESDTLKKHISYNSKLKAKRDFDPNFITDNHINIYKNVIAHFQTYDTFK
jgi:glycosyltransferase involved in cell wall biosynthesis